MEGLVLFIHIVVCTLLVVVVLLQSGKSADLAGAFGGGGSQSTFGPRGTASILSRLTTTLAVLFMITSLTLWILAANRADSRSVVTKDDVKKATEKPADTGKTEESKSPTDTGKKESTENPVNKEGKQSGTQGGEGSEENKSKGLNYN